MDDVKAGLQVRAVRLNRGLRQVEVAAAARTSRQTVSRLGRGELTGMTVGTIRRVSRALGMPPLATLGWRGAEMAELLDAGHARLVDEVVSRLRQDGWQTTAEHTFNSLGERGSVDVLGWRSGSGVLLLMEVKTRIVDLGDLLSTLDRKRRVVPGLWAAEKLVTVQSVGVVVVLPDCAASRRAIHRHAATFESSFPARTVDVRRWLANPAGNLRGVWFLTERGLDASG